MGNLLLFNAFWYYFARTYGYMKLKITKQQEKELAKIKIYGDKWNAEQRKKRKQEKQK